MRLAIEILASIVLLLSSLTAHAVLGSTPPPLDADQEGTALGVVDDDAAAGPAEREAGWAVLLRAVEVLLHGSRAEKLALFEDGEGESALVALASPPGDDERAEQVVVGTLRDWFRTETDVLVLDLAARELVEAGAEAARPIFLDLATSRAPSLRYRAVRNAAELDDDEDEELLVEMLRVETVPWVQAEIIEAMREVDLALDLADCGPLVWSDDPDLADAAIRCVAEVDQPEAGEILAARAASGADTARFAALHALAVWLGANGPTPSIATSVGELWRSGAFPMVRATLFQVLRSALPEEARALAASLMWDDDPEVASLAIAVLGDSGDRDAGDLLIARAREGAPALRAAAIDALDAQVLPGPVATMLSTLLQVGEPSEVRAAAARALGGERYLRFLPPDPSAGAYATRLPWATTLQSLADSDPDDDVRAAARHSPLVAPQGVVSLSDNLVLISTYCGEFVRDGEAFMVHPADQEGSTRCYRWPGVERTAADALRVPAGALGVREDRFDDGIERWVSLSVESETCWLSERSVERMDPLVSVAAFDPNGPVVNPETSEAGASAGTEFDVPVEWTAAEWFRRLQEVGIVETFDPGTALVGARVVETLSEDQRAALLGRADWVGTPLEKPLRAVLGSGATTDRTTRGSDR